MSLEAIGADEPSGLPAPKPKASVGRSQVILADMNTGIHHQRNIRAIVYDEGGSGIAAHPGDRRCLIEHSPAVGPLVPQLQDARPSLDQSLGRVNRSQPTHRKQGCVQKRVEPGNPQTP